MTRTRYTAHTATVATLALLATATALATTASSWSMPVLAAASGTAYLAGRLHLRARREQAVAQQLARLLALGPPQPYTLTPGEEQAFAAIIHHLAKDHTT